RRPLSPRGGPLTDAPAKIKPSSRPREESVHDCHTATVTSSWRAGGMGNRQTTIGAHRLLRPGWAGARGFVMIHRPLVAIAFAIWTLSGLAGPAWSQGGAGKSAHALDLDAGPSTGSAPD